MRLSIVFVLVVIVTISMPAFAGLRDDEALQKAASACDLELTSIVLKRGANPNAFPSASMGSAQYSALMSAVVQSVALNQEICSKEVEILVEAGGNPNLQNEFGESAMTLAAPFDVAAEALDALLAHHGNPDIQMHITARRNIVAQGTLDKESTTPLMIMAMDSALDQALSSASYNNHEKAVHKLQALLKRANPNIQGIKGITALMLAAQAGNKFIVQSLLAAGANPNLKDKKGQTALDYALANSQTEIVKLLPH